MPEAKIMISNSDLNGKVRVFLVDDHPVVREGISRLLELDERVQVVGEADNAEEALGRVMLTSANVVLMDIKLPGMDGIEATRRLTERNPDLRVVILSSFGDSYLTPCMEAGASGYILKTATQSEMVSAVIRAAAGQTPIDPALAKMLLNRPGRQTHQRQRQGLSDRQKEIIKLIAEGVTSKDIALRLYVSDATLTRELRRVFDFLGVADRAHAVAEAYRQQML